MDYNRLFRDIGFKALELLRKIDGGKDLVGDNPLGQKSLKADVELEKLARGHLTDVGGLLVAEESGENVLGPGGDIFVLDPLDGSRNYYNGVPYYGLAIAVSSEKNYSGMHEAYVINLVSGDEWWTRHERAYMNGKRIKSSTERDLANCVIEYDPNHNPKIYERIRKLLPRVRDVRRFGANAVSLCHLAQGCHHAFIDINNNLSIIHTPGLFIAETAGCVVTAPDGSEFTAGLSIDDSLSFVASANKSIHEQVLDLLG